VKVVELLRSETEIKSLLRRKLHPFKVAFQCWSGLTMVVPRRWLASQEYAHRFCGRWHQVYGRTTVERKAPIGYGRRTADLESKLDLEFPDFGVLEMEKGYLVGPQGWVVSREG
jgi:hypothetical protein